MYIQNKFKIENQINIHINHSGIVTNIKEGSLKFLNCITSTENINKNAITIAKLRSLKLSKVISNSPSHSILYKFHKSSLYFNQYNDQESNSNQ